MTWAYDNNDTIALLIMLQCGEDILGPEETLEEFYNALKLGSLDSDFIFSIIQNHSEASELYQSTISALESGTLKQRYRGEINYETVVYGHDFVEWLSKHQSIDPSRVLKACEENYQKVKGDDYLIHNYLEDQQNKPSFETAQLHLDEQLWNVYEAIFYLHGYKLTQSEKFGLQCIKYYEHFYDVLCSIENAKAMGDLKFYPDRNYNYDNLKPLEFIKWSRSFNISFALYHFMNNATGVGFIEAIASNDGYSTEYLDLMIKAIKDLELSHSKKPPKVEEIQDYLCSQDPTLSKSNVTSMATFLRPKKAGIGGRPKSDK